MDNIDLGAPKGNDYSDNRSSEINNKNNKSDKDGGMPAFTCVLLYFIAILAFFAGFSVSIWFKGAWAIILGILCGEK